MLWSLFRIAVGVYIVFGVILFVFQRRFIFFPHSEVEMTPHRIGLEFEDVSFQADDAVELTGWFVPAPAEARAVVLFCHGNAGNISHRLPTLEMFHQLGLSTFIFDYRGYGCSAGKPTEKGTRQDAQAAWRYLTEGRNIPSDKIIVFGRSLGGAVAARLAADLPAGAKPAGLVTESTFTSVVDLAQKMYPVYPVRLLALHRFDALDCMKRLECPVLIAHSRDDKMIPYSHGQRLFAAASEPKTFLELRGGHNDPPAAANGDYEDALQEFISACVNTADHSSSP